MVIMLKLEEKEQPKAEIVKNPNPINSSDLCLNLTLKAPMSNAKMTATLEERVRTCPITPTELPNVRPISIRRSPVRILGGCVAKPEMTSDGRISLVELFLIKSELLLIFYHGSFRVDSSRRSTIFVSQPDLYII